MKKNLISNKEAVSPVIGVILMVAITVILAAVVIWFVFGGSAESSQTNESPAVSSKNPNIQYFEKNTVKISGNNSDELAKNIAGMRKENCWIDDTIVITEAVNNGTIRSSIIARTNDCAAKYK